MCFVLYTQTIQFTYSIIYFFTKAIDINTEILGSDNFPAETFQSLFFFRIFQQFPQL